MFAAHMSEVTPHMEQMSLATDRGVETNIKRENRGTHEERQDVQVSAAQSWDDEFSSLDNFGMGAVELVALMSTTGSRLMTHWE